MQLTKQELNKILEFAPELNDQDLIKLVVCLASTMLHEIELKELLTKMN